MNNLSVSYSTTKNISILERPHIEQIRNFSNCAFIEQDYRNNINSVIIFDIIVFKMIFDEIFNSVDMICLSNFNDYDFKNKERKFRAVKRKCGFSDKHKCITVIPSKNGLYSFKVNVKQVKKIYPEYILFNKNNSNYLQFKRNFNMFEFFRIILIFIIFFVYYLFLVPMNTNKDFLGSEWNIKS